MVPGTSVVTRRPDEEGPEPEDGRAASRLRQHLESRFGTDEWPEEAAIDDVRAPETGQPGGSVEERVDRFDDPEDSGEYDASSMASEPEEPPESNPYELNEEETED